MPREFRSDDSLLATSRGPHPLFRHRADCILEKVAFFATMAGVLHSGTPSYGEGVTGACMLFLFFATFSFGWLGVFSSLGQGVSAPGFARADSQVHASRTVGTT